MQEPIRPKSGNAARDQAWDCELSFRRIAVARWRGMDHAVRASEGASGGSCWSHQRRDVAGTRGRSSGV